MQIPCRRGPAWDWWRLQAAPTGEQGGPSPVAQPSHLLGREHDVRRSQGLAQVRDAVRARDGHDGGRPVHEPGEGHLVGRHAQFRRETGGACEAWPCRRRAASPGSCFSRCWSASRPASAGVACWARRSCICACRKGYASRNCLSSDAPPALDSLWRCSWPPWLLGQERCKTLPRWARWPHAQRLGLPLLQRRPWAWCAGKWAGAGA